MAKSEPLVRAGVDFTNRGELKYARAVHLANELRGRIDEWSAAETLLARIEKVDDHTFEFRAVVKREPPIDEWSLILGDALHNLRSAFDNVMWALAHLDGAKPKVPTQVAFPLTRDVLDWDKRIQTLESIPAIFLDRIKKLQPWIDGGERDDNMFWLLHKLDIADKHQGLISGALHLTKLSTPGLEMNLQPEVSVAEAQLSYSIQEQPIRIAPETVLTRVHSDTHKLNPDPEYLAKVWVQFVLDWGESRILLLDAFLGDVLSRTREWLDRIYGGDLYAKALILSRQSSGPAVIFGYEDEDGSVRMTQLPMSGIDADPE